MSDINRADDRELVAFSRAMCFATDWSAERVIDFFAWPQRYEREFLAWSLLGQPARDDDPGWDTFSDLANGSEARLREYLIEAQG